MSGGANTASILRLVELLEEEAAEWDDIEETLINFPGWLALARALRYPTKPIDNRIHWQPVQVEFTQVSAKDREAMLTVFRPIALLVTPALTPQEKIIALKQIDEDPLGFCREHVGDGVPEVAANAGIIIDLIRGDKTLLRSRPAPLEPNELLRNAEAGGDEDLIRPANEGAHSKHRSWIDKLLHRK